MVLGPIIRSAGREAGIRADPGRSAFWSFAASCADHLQTGDAQLTILLFARCVLKLSFFLFFGLRFAGDGTANGHFVANVLVKLDAAAEAPGPTVLASKGELTRLVAFLQATGHGLCMAPGLGIVLLRGVLFRCVLSQSDQGHQ